jgi:hypothetical protein
MIAIIIIVVWPKSYPCSAASHAVDGGIVVEVTLARQREDLVLGPPHPENDFNNQFQSKFTKKVGHFYCNIKNCFSMSKMG